MEIKLFNTQTKQKEELKPIKLGTVTMYNCGPTVYNYAHIGNISSYIFSDILRRTAEYNGLKVEQVINITDFGHISGDADSGDDKMMLGLKRENLPISMEGLTTLTEKYTKTFVDDLKALNIEMPTYLPKATDHIEDDIELIKNLEDKGLTYSTADAIYFDTSKIEDYGKLGGLPDELQSRIGDVIEKKNPRDFSLWKFSDEFGWPSPWGQGFPGWHIECSAMAMKYLGQTIDIHTGGIDHISVHHNNEIAQSEHATGKPFANIWMHRAHMRMNGEKLAKSTGNVAYVKDFADNNIHPISFRYWTLLSHYSTGTDFTIEAVLSAQNALENIVSDLIGIKGNGKILQDYKDRFINAINDDLDTPKAIAIMWEVLKSGQSNQDRKATLLDFDKVLGLDIAGFLMKNDDKNANLSEHIKGLLERRKAAREGSDWPKSDEIRDLLKEHGYIVSDSENGQKLSPVELLK